MPSQSVAQNFKDLIFLFVNAWSRETSVSYFSIQIFFFIKSGSFQFEGTHFKAVAMGDVYKVTEVWVVELDLFSLQLLVIKSRMVWVGKTWKSIHFILLPAMDFQVLPEISFLNIIFLPIIYAWPYMDSV